MQNDETRRSTGRWSIVILTGSRGRRAAGRRGTRPPDRKGPVTADGDEPSFRRRLHVVPVVAKPRQFAHPAQRIRPERGRRRRHRPDRASSPNGGATERRGVRTGSRLADRPAAASPPAGWQVSPSPSPGRRFPSDPPFWASGGLSTRPTESTARTRSTSRTSTEKPGRNWRNRTDRSRPWTNFDASETPDGVQADDPSSTSLSGDLPRFRGFRMVQSVRTELSGERWPRFKEKGPRSTGEGSPSRSKTSTLLAVNSITGRFKRRANHSTAGWKSFQRASSVTATPLLPASRSWSGSSRPCALAWVKSLRVVPVATQSHPPRANRVALIFPSRMP